MGPKVSKRGGRIRRGRTNACERSALGWFQFASAAGPPLRRSYVSRQLCAFCAPRALPPVCNPSCVAGPVTKDDQMKGVSYGGALRRTNLHSAPLLASHGVSTTSCVTPTSPTRRARRTAHDHCWELIECRHSTDSSCQQTGGTGRRRERHRMLGKKGLDLDRPRGFNRVVGFRMLQCDNTHGVFNLHQESSLMSALGPEVSFCILPAKEIPCHVDPQHNNAEFWASRCSLDVLFPQSDKALLQQCRRWVCAVRVMRRWRPKTSWR